MCTWIGGSAEQGVSVSVSGVYSAPLAAGCRPHLHWSPLLFEIEAHSAVARVLRVLCGGCPAVLHLSCGGRD